MFRQYKPDFDKLSKEKQSQVIAEVTGWDKETICLTT